MIGPSDSAAGAAVAGLGDTNGDGLSEFAVGAPIASAVYLVEAPLDGTLELSSVKILEDTGADQAGSAVLGIGDVTGDGHGGLVVGARISSTNGNKAGASFALWSRIVMQMLERLWCSCVCADRFNGCATGTLRGQKKSAARSLITSNWKRSLTSLRSSIKAMETVKFNQQMISLRQQIPLQQTALEPEQCCPNPSHRGHRSLW